MLWFQHRFFWLIWQIFQDRTEAVVRRCSVKKMFWEISQDSQESTCARVSFEFWVSCEFWEISKNTFFYRTLLVVASNRKKVSLTHFMSLVSYACHWSLPLENIRKPLFHWCFQDYKNRKVEGDRLICLFNPFHVNTIYFNAFQYSTASNVPFLYPLKTSENLWFSDNFRGYKNGILGSAEYCKVLK